jgi:hypothetical protein
VENLSQDLQFQLLSNSVDKTMQTSIIIRLAIN